ncbi:NAD(P)H-dependent oxidoreductase [Dellaglioa sp. P0083]|uniref:NAD(P)H-dependent oxidoreductase n=1 Tax=Dellaglioa kimchii TaxID=3344667 RepID=UPI0038D50978
MKKICIIFDHPYTANAGYNELHNRSYSAALLVSAKAAYEKKGCTVDVIDLHKDGFDPVMHQEDLISWRKKIPTDSMTANYQERLMAADELVFIFPIWWESMPAMMKGFFDKVIAKGILYTEQENKKLFKNEMVHLKKVKMVTTMSIPGCIYRTIFGSPVTKMVFRGTFRKMGFNQLKWFNFAAVQGMKLEKRQQLLKKFENNIVK